MPFHNALSHYRTTHKREFGTEPTTEMVGYFADQFRSRVIRASLDATEPRPDYFACINPDICADDAVFLIDRLVRPGTSTGLIAPTGSGGSTVLINVTKALLTGEPLFGTFAMNVDPDEVHVVWVNPEEAAGTPRQRLHEAGLPRGVVEGQFTELFVRDQRLSLNDERYVESAVEALQPEVEGAGFVVVIIDGVPNTLRGDAWNADLEAWKDGLGQLRLALGCDTVFGRIQVTGAAARGARRFGQAVNMEDVKGAQLAEWPDQRWILGYPKKDGEKSKADTDRRNLEIRGRRVESTSFTLGYDPLTHRLTMEDGTKALMATVEVSGLGTDQEFQRAVASGVVNPASTKSVADWLAKRSVRQNPADPNSPSTYRRALSDVDIEAMLAQSDLVLSS